MSILSINSQVAYGHVGNAAATFVLQRLGHEVWPLPTVLFSNHPGHGDFRGRAVAAALLSELLAGLERRGAPAACEAVLSGYLGDESQGEVVRAAVTKARSHHAHALYCCDPVIGDEKGFYVEGAIAAVIKTELAPLADLLTPNRFELEYLADHAVASLEDAIAACERLRGLGPKVVVCTSLADRGGDAETIATLAVAEGGAWLVRTPVLGRVPHGAGDLFAALFLGRYLVGRDVSAALCHAVSATFAVLSASVAAGADELTLVAAQDEIVAPGRMFVAESVA